MAVVAIRDFSFEKLQFALDQANAQVRATTDLTEKRTMRATKKRLQDCLYQRKHRAKRERKMVTLEHDILTLRSDVAYLYQTLHRYKVATENQQWQERQRSNDLLETHAQSVVTQFFRVYQDGDSRSLSEAQEHFLRSMIASDVEGVDLWGIDAFVQQWWLNDQLFALYALEPQKWTVNHIGTQCVVEVDVMLYFCCHGHTISSLFPSLETGWVDLELVQPLVTGTTTVAGTYTFVFNRAGYVSKLLVSLQLLETLRRVLGSLQNVVKVTDGGRIALGSGTITVA